MTWPNSRTSVDLHKVQKTLTPFPQIPFPPLSQIKKPLRLQLQPSHTHPILTLHRNQLQHCIIATPYSGKWTSYK